MAVKKLVREDGNEILVDRALKDADGGTIASQEWVQENVPQGPKGDKGDPGSIEGAGFPLTLQNSTGVVKAEFNSGIKSSTETIQTPHLDLQDANDKARYTAYGIIPFSSSASSATGKLLSFPIGEEGTFATQEWVEENKGSRYINENWYEDISCQTAIPLVSLSSFPMKRSSFVRDFGTGAKEFVDGFGYSVFARMSGEMHILHVIYDENNDNFTFHEDGGIIKEGDVVNIAGVVAICVSSNLQNIWDWFKVINGRWSVLPSVYKNSLTIQDMRDCDIKVYYKGAVRSGWNVYSARNCSLIIDTKDYAETMTGGGTLSCQARIYGDNATLVGGATPVLRDNAGNSPSIRAPYSTVGNEIYINVNYIQYDQNGNISLKADGTMVNNMWVCPFRPTWTYTDTDGTQKDLRLNFRYEFAESGQPRMDLIPYIVPHVETQSVSVMSASPEQPEDVQAPIVPSGRRGCFTLDDEGHTIDAFTGEIIE